MARKLIRSAAASIVVAAAALAGPGLPAQAGVRPGVAPQTEYVITYYSTAQETTVVGQVTFGCTSSDWGSRTSYYTSHTYACTP